MLCSLSADPNPEASQPDGLSLRELAEDPAMVALLDFFSGLKPSQDVLMDAMHRLSVDSMQRLKLWQLQQRRGTAPNGAAGVEARSPEADGAKEFELLASEAASATVVVAQRAAGPAAAEAAAERGEEAVPDEEDTDDDMPPLATLDLQGTSLASALASAEQPPGPERRGDSDDEMPPMTGAPLQAPPYGDAGAAAGRGRRRIPASALNPRPQGAQAPPEEGAKEAAASGAPAEETPFQEEPLLSAVQAQDPLRHRLVASFQRFNLEKWAQPLGDLSFQSSGHLAVRRSSGYEYTHGAGPARDLAAAARACGSELPRRRRRDGPVRG